MFPSFSGLEFPITQTQRPHFWYLALVDCQHEGGVSFSPFKTEKEPFCSQGKGTLEKLWFTEKKQNIDSNFYILQSLLRCFEIKHGTCCSFEKFECFESSKIIL